MTPTEAQIAAAKERRTANAAQVRQRSGFEDEHDWIGTLGEDCMTATLRAEGIEVVRNGGVDAKPDLEIARFGGSEVKTRRRSDGEFRPWYDVPVAAQTLRKPVPPYLLFAAYVEASNTLILLGAISATRYFSEAHFVRAGQQIAGSGHETPIDVFQLRADRLKPMTDTINYLKGTR